MPITREVSLRALCDGPGHRFSGREYRVFTGPTDEDALAAMKEAGWNQSVAAGIVWCRECVNAEIARARGVAV